MNTKTLSPARHLQPDKIASSTAPCELPPARVALSDYVVAEEGYCLAVRALADKETYNEVECTDGSFRCIRKGDVLVGVLGERQALKGYSGRVPRTIHTGDTLNVLNLGGIIGRCTSHLPELGEALPVEVLGAVLSENEDRRCHARIQDHAVEPAYTLADSAPLVVVSGTAMDTGKTSAACQIIEGLTEGRGLDVAAAKLTGAALQRDVRRMREHGASACATFTDAGIVASTNKKMGPHAKGLIEHLNAGDPDLIVLEMGDGFIGYYGVDELLRDKELQRFTRAHVVTATDLAGAWAADETFHERYRSSITVMTGPITDNAVGRQYIQNELGVPAVNALQDGETLTDIVAETLDEEAGLRSPRRTTLRPLQMVADK
jgi:hypothetical protein